MKSSRSSSTFSRAGFGVLLVLAALAVTPHHAAANTAANTKIINFATVNYKDSTNTTAQTPVTAFATVTVTLVAVAPTLTAPADQNSTLGSAATFSYNITTNANGPDTYALSTSANGGSVTNSTHILTSSAVPSAASVVLGASTIVTPITIAAATDTAITVPSDGVADATPSVNGIVGGDTVVINSLVYSVISVVDNAAGTSTITVNGPASAALPYGTLISERKTFTLDVTPLTMNATITNETVTTIISAKGTGAAAADTTVTTVLPANLTVTKEVSTDGSTWGATANAAPGNTLYYRITVTNTGAANATAVVITDPLTSYTTYTLTSAKKATAAASNYADGTNTVLIDTIAGAADGYDWNETTLGSITFSAGTIAPGANVQLFFKVTVK